MVARGERERRVDLLEAVVEEDLRRDAEVVPEADAPAEALVLQDGEVLRGLRVADEHVAVAEEVARVVVEELRLGDPAGPRELRVGEARAQRELAVGHGERAAEGDARAGEVGLGDLGAAVGGERPAVAARIDVGREAEPEVVDDDRVALGRRRRPG